MKPFILFATILTIFLLAFLKHISAVMYPLSAIIFYRYLPVLYTASRINTLHHAKGKEFIHRKFYPIELSIWLISTCFLSFIIAHLLTDLLFLYLKSLYHLTYFLISLGLAGIVFYEIDASRLHLLSKKTAFKQQGLFLSIEIFLFFFLFFAKNH